MQQTGEPSTHMHEKGMAASDHVRQPLDQKLSGLSSYYHNDSLKVPPNFRLIKEEAYEPRMVSIGPYHHGKEQLKHMEMYKLHFLKRFLQEQDVATYVHVMREIEREARDFYDQAVFDKFGRKDFLEMMVVDGCFIVGLIVELISETPRKEQLRDGLAKANLITIKHDLLLLENQLPFIVLLTIYRMRYRNESTEYEDESRRSHKSDLFFFGARDFFLDILPGPVLILIQIPAQDVKHLLALIHGLCRPSPQGINCYHILMEEQYKSEWRFIRSASELREAGIMFEEYKKVKDEKGSLFDISFDNGKMKIPILSVYNDTERFFRNLMAYEQFTISGPTYVTDYIIFMDSLINSGRDVKILCCRGIINHWLGDDEDVAQMFNRLRNFIIKSGDEFYYAETFNNVNMHCSRRRNVWKARFWDDYCDTPWALISLLAAAALLLLALAQTIFAVMAYIKES